MCLSRHFHCVIKCAYSLSLHVLIIRSVASHHTALDHKHKHWFKRCHHNQKSSQALKIIITVITYTVTHWISIARRARATMADTAQNQQVRVDHRRSFTIDVCILQNRCRRSDSRNTVEAFHLHHIRRSLHTLTNLSCWIGICWVCWRWVNYLKAAKVVRVMR